MFDALRLSCASASTPADHGELQPVLLDALSHPSRRRAQRRASTRSTVRWTAHELAHITDDVIHDAVLDYYGKRLATCSSDRTVRIFDVSGPDGSEYTLVDTLRGHDGPVWQVAWAHPKFGSILASCSYDGRVFVWREASSGPGRSSWQRIKEHSLHNASVNSISWAPHELGAILACASSDGKVSVLQFNDDGTWDAAIFPAHTLGCNAISWAPATLPGSLIQPQQQPQGATAPAIARVKRFATGGCDGLVKIWAQGETGDWAVQDELKGHADWVRDVAWAPNIGLPRSYIASAGQDKAVYVWVQDTPRSTNWTKVALDPTPATAGQPAVGAGGKFADVVWRVSWSVAGQVLAVSVGDGQVTLFKESLKGNFEPVNEIS